ncbi:MULTISPECIES: mannosyl-3-phosphoglycerate phosphatase [unclassified Oceanobacter]|jgi:mannosyl-3-phosphoglycerate phosphatase|uniref:HAD-IIB family hydrolase n=1 Tax=unclassified Oceanobacter TaxID=2620260 RepID=UPI0026E1299A|nr:MULTISPECIES: HAD-IIB family hydrolase [unclassified Oceanobacter]MDO6681461.1 HAD-IIB family hydrolase [Oceanobacter sp. 5_MG-2023]MDP2506702.1 HAD-IIB family hydrolase [Oceanobacter sp. 3_MG-2023]
MSSNTSQCDIPTVPLVVMTDLDGTLLDHHNYSANAALPALKRLRALHIPVLFNTSKTCDEVSGLRHELDNRYPFVCENGSVIHIPKPDATGFNSEVLGVSYVDILKALHQLQHEGFHFRGFNDMPATEVAAMTGLSQDNAWLAKKRQASEPLLWHDSDEALERFRQRLAEYQLTLTKGGRFYHVMGTTNKASGLDFFRQYYQHQWQLTPQVAALGDGENDRAMLEAADYPIVIPGENQTLTLQHPSARTAAHKGPAGWNTEILTLLEQLS